MIANIIASSTMVSFVMMLLLGLSAAASSTPSYSSTAFSACTRLAPMSSSRATCSHFTSLNRRHDTSLHSSSPSSSIPTIPLDITNANTNTNAAAIFDAVVTARYACTRFLRHQESENSNIITTAINNTNSSNTAITPTKLSPSSSSSSSSSSFQPPIASISNPQIIQMAHQSLLLSQRAPSGFNAQPYRIILVHSQKDKENVAQYCLGRNADRVRDSDCTAIFLADVGVGWDGRRYIDFLKRHMSQNVNGDSVVEEKKDEDSLNRNITSTDTTITSTRSTTISSTSSRSRRSLSARELLKVRLLILLFSSGYPLPSFLSVPFSFFVRLGVSILGAIMRWLYSIQQRLLLSSDGNNNNNNNNNNTRSILKRLYSNLLAHRHIQLLPTLHTSQTWSQKNTMLVAMTYILSCTSHGLATCPMEGYDAVGIKKVLGVQPIGRYSIPLIVSTGLPYHRHEQQHRQPQSDGENGKEIEVDDETTMTDDAGLSHGSGALLSPRYPSEEVVYENSFGMSFQL